MTDHLGSVRVIVDGTGKMLEQNDYYPFRARHVRSDYSQLASSRFKYNGKEEQVAGNLEWLDYGARMYDSGLGRWFSVDSLLEKYYSLSSYNYCGNNALNTIDVGGKLIIFVNGFNPTEYVSHVGMNISENAQKKTISRYSPDRSFQRHDFYGWANIDKLYMATYKNNNALYVK